MPKVKVARKSTAIDMTAMCDVAFLLLTFFILTTKFKPKEPVVIDIPASHGKQIKDKDIVLISMAPDGRTFWDIDNPKIRRSTLEQMGERYSITFSTDEYNKFELNKNAIIAVKGDKTTDYPSVKAVIKTFELKNILRFNFVTSLEGKEETAEK